MYVPICVVDNMVYMSIANNNTWHVPIFVSVQQRYSSELDFEEF